MRYKLFGRGTGLRVSEIALGCVTFGSRWGYGAEPDEARRIFDSYAEAGGNFIDTADAYQMGQSEELVGESLPAGATILYWRRSSRLAASQRPGRSPSVTAAKP